MRLMVRVFALFFNNLLSSPLVFLSVSVLAEVSPWKPDRRRSCRNCLGLQLPKAHWLCRLRCPGFRAEARALGPSQATYPTSLTAGLSISLNQLPRDEMHTRQWSMGADHSLDDLSGFCFSKRKVRDLSRAYLMLLASSVWTLFPTSQQVLHSFTWSDS